MPCAYHVAQATEIKRGKHTEDERNVELAYLAFEQGSCRGCKGEVI